MSIFSSLLDVLVDNVTAALVFCLIFAVVYMVWQHTKSSPYRLPPGPMAWPFLGNMASFNPTEEDPSGAKRLTEYVKKYKSDDITLYLGSTPAVCLQNYEDIKNLFNKEEFAGRGQYSPIIKQIFQGIIFSDGPRWKEQRRFALSTLRDFGLGKNKLELKVHAELEKFTDILDSFNGSPIDFTPIISPAISNIICNMIFGHRFEYTDPQFKHAVAIMNENFNENVEKAFLGSMIPGAYFISDNLPGDIFRLKRMREIVRDLHDNFYDHEYKKHLSKYDPENIDDFIDAFIKEMHIKQKNDTDEEHWFTVKQLFHAIDDLFQAGTETTSSTLRWLVLYMMAYPDVQAKVRAEIHEAIGRERMPSMRDKASLPYTEAMLCELRRLATLAQISAGNSTFDQPTRYKDYILPPYTLVLANFHHIHMDPDHWEQPEEFKPERFLDKDGKFTNEDRLLTFSTGKRSCLGEGLARMELLLFTVSILQKYRVCPAAGVPLPPLTPLLGSITAGPKPYKVCFVRD